VTTPRVMSEQEFFDKCELPALKHVVKNITGREITEEEIEFARQKTGYALIAKLSAP
jgi:hypothetical protein